MTKSISPEPARYANGRFGPGNPGRPVGSRNRVSKRVALAVLDLLKVHPEALPVLLTRNPKLYLELVGRLLPRPTIKMVD